MTGQLIVRLRVAQLRVIFFALGVLDILMDRCSFTFHKEVSSQLCMKQLVSMLNNPKMNPEITTRVAYLIKKWGLRFQKQQQKLPNFTQVYLALIKKGVQFPEVTESSRQSAQGAQEGQGSGNAR